MAPEVRTDDVLAVLDKRISRLKKLTLPCEGDKQTLRALQAVRRDVMKLPDRPSSFLERRAVKP